MTEPVSYYELLGVPPTATPAEVRRAYRAAAKRFHPDVCDAPDAPAQFARFTRAYEVLSDPAQRAAYDRSLLPRREHPSTPGDRRAHYTWSNIAGGKITPDDDELFREIYDALFATRHPRSRRA